VQRGAEESASGAATPGLYVEKQRAKSQRQTRQLPAARRAAWWCVVERTQICCRGVQRLSVGVLLPPGVGSQGTSLRCRTVLPSAAHWSAAMQR